MAGEAGADVDFDVTEEDLEIEIDESEGDGKPAEGDKPKGDARASSGNDEDGDDDDRRSGETDDERKARRAQEGRERRDRRRTFVQQDNLIIQELTGQLRQLESRLNEQGQEQLQISITNATAARDRWIRRGRELAHMKAQAIDEGRGADVVKIDEAIDEAKQSARWFESKIETTKSEATKREEALRAGPSPEQVKANNARNFLARHPGFDPKLGDEDSRAAKAIDIALEREGYDATTADYWLEFERRINERGIDLGQKRDDDEPPPRSHPSDRQPRDNGKFAANEPRKGPPVGGKSAGGKQTIKVPASVVNMIKEAGMWDDPKTRNEMLKEYQRNLDAQKK